MNIVVSPGTYDLLNLGDVAMLQACVGRLRALRPTARICVLTNDPASLARLCPGTVPLSDEARRIWFSDTELLGPVHRRVPRTVSAALQAGEAAIRHSAPGFHNLMIRTKERLHGSAGAAAFYRAMATADLLVVAGQGTINDHFVRHSRLILQTVELALSLGARVVLLGQGIGPLDNDQLRSFVRRTLPKVDLIAVREGVTGPALLSGLGVPQQRIVVTGDDAVEQAFRLRRARLGTALGVNLRVADHAGLARDSLPLLRRVLKRMSGRLGASLVPLPIATHEGSQDQFVLRQLTGDATETSWPEPLRQHPDDLIRRAGNCRVVITGAYHAAVFALSQGIPALCLCGNAYYEAKFRGLAGQFGPGCVLYRMGETSEDALSEAIGSLWQQADSFHASLRRAAEEQIGRAGAALSMLGDLLPAHAAAAAGAKV